MDADFLPDLDVLQLKSSHIWTAAKSDFTPKQATVIIV